MPAHRTSSGTIRRPVEESGSSSSQQINDASKNPHDCAGSEDPIYTSGSKSYDGRVRRKHLPPAIPTITKGRPADDAADLNLNRVRDRIIALIAKTSDQRLRKSFPVVQAVLTGKSSGASFYAKPSARIRSKRIVNKNGELRAANGKLMLPQLPSGLRWPKKTFSSEYHKRGVTIVQFLEQEWSGLIKAGYGQLRWLRMVDSTAARAVDTYERVDPQTKQRRLLPEHLRFLREREVTDVKLARGLDEIANDPRLLEAIAGRVRRGMHVHL